MVKKAAYISLPVFVAIAAYCVRFFELPSFFPCIFREVTGLYCLGCGGTRAAYSLLKGDFLKALGYNAFFVLLIPFGLYFYIAGFAQTFFHKKLLPVPRNKTPWLWALLGAAILFMFVRNIDFFPFYLLQP